MVEPVMWNGRPSADARSWFESSRRETKLGTLADLVYALD